MVTWAALEVVLVRLLVLTALLLAACGIRDPERVARIAERAAHDPRQVGRLVQALKSDDPEAWREAYARLVELGPAAIPALEDAVLARHPASGRALLVLGEMGEPRNLDFLEEALAVPVLRPYATEALALAEDVLWDRLREERDLALCDAFLAHFGGSGRRREVALLRHDLLAESAWARLGRRPRDADILAFLDAYGDTPTGGTARRELSGRLLVDAGRELGRSRPEVALQHVARARELDPEVDADPVEAAVRYALGRVCLDRGDADGAVHELQQALALGAGSDVRAALAGAWLDRARVRFRDGAYVSAMADLARVRELEPELEGTVSDLRRQQVEALLLLLEAPGGTPEGVVEALVLAGPAARVPLEGALWHALARGDAGPLARVVDISAQEAPARTDERRWITNMMERALSEADGDMRLLLSDPARLDALFVPSGYLHGGADSPLEAAALVLRRYVAVVTVAHRHRLRLGPVAGPLPASPPLPDDEVVTLLQAGHDGRDSLGLPPLTRAQLLLHQVDRALASGALLRERPAAVAGGVLSSGEAAFRLTQWSAVLDRAVASGPGAVAWCALPGGRPARVEARASGSTLEVRVSASGAPDAGLGLALLFSLARPAFAALPEVDRVEVRWSEEASLGEELLAGLTRGSAARMDWRIVEEEAPYGPDHLVLVPGARVVGVGP